MTTLKAINKFVDTFFTENNLEKREDYVVGRCYAKGS